MKKEMTVLVRDLLRVLVSIAEEHCRDEAGGVLNTRFSYSFVRMMELLRDYGIVERVHPKIRTIWKWKYVVDEDGYEVRVADLL